MKTAVRNTMLGLLAAAAVAGSAPVRLSVLPENPMLFGKGAEQRLAVLAHHADGRVEDVTALARFKSVAPEVARVSADGMLQAAAFGGARIEANYAGV